MPSLSIQTILLPTDFSIEAQVAFHHALKLSLALKAELVIFHVEPDNDTSDWRWGPHVVETLVRWGVLPAGATEGDLEAHGIKIRRSMKSGVRASAAILEEIARTHADLVVTASHGRAGLEAWVQPSVATPIALKGAVPVLLLPPNVQGFVNAETGKGGLERVLIPVASLPHPAPAFDAATLLARALPGESVHLATLNIGEGIPEVSFLQPDDGWRIDHWAAGGPVVDRIQDTTLAWKASMVVAVTEGRHGFFDAVRGSTVERLIAEATTPVLIVPDGWAQG